MKPMPNELYNELVDGLTLLTYARLSYAPQTEDELEEVIKALEWTLCAHADWDLKYDQGRIAAAFSVIAPQLEKRPQPVMLIKHLPPRPLPPALPMPKGEPCPPEIKVQLDALTAGLLINKKTEV